MDSTKFNSQTIKKDDCKFFVRKFTKFSDLMELKNNIVCEISKLANVIWREHYTPIIGTEQVEYMLEKFQSEEKVYSDIVNDNYTYFTAECTEHKKMVGYCAVTPKEDYILLSKIYIHKDYRGKGIAHKFLHEVYTLCKKKYGFNKIRLTVNKYNTNAIAAYHKIGFSTIDSVKVDIGDGFFMDDYIMEKEII